MEYSILKITNETRNMHGLRHNDYERYRQFCSGKIKRLRKSVNLKQMAGKKYAKNEITVDMDLTANHLSILLFQTERNWSYAMQLKVESQEHPRKRHQLIRKLEKAKQNSAVLENLIKKNSGLVDDLSNLEIKAYSALMHGYLLFERQDWEKALDKFTTSKAIYEKLSHVTTSKQHQALCFAVLDSNEPNIRYCAYKLGNSLDVSSLLELKKAKGFGLEFISSEVDSVLAKNRNKNFKAKRFRDNELPIKNEKLLDKILETEQAEVQLDSKLKNSPDSLKFDVNKKFDFELAEKILEIYDSVLGLYWDCNKISESDIKEDELATKKVSSSKSEENTNNLKLIHCFVSYSRLSRTIERNLLLIEITKAKLGTQNSKEKKGPKSEDVIKLFDTVLKSLNEINDISCLENDPTIKNIISIKILLYKAIRCHFVAKSYSELNKTEEAQLLLEKTKEYITKGKSLLLSTSNRGSNALLDTDVEELKNLKYGFEDFEKVLFTSIIEEKVLKFLKKDEKRNARLDSKKNNVLSLEENLNTFNSGFDMKEPNLISFPPAFKCITTKPFFFDIAYNSIEYPQEKKKTGLSGWFGF